MDEKAQLPSDHDVRRRFSEEIEKSFSLIAPAGSGKTRALSKRVASIARSPAAKNLLPRLVAVTYTNKAADEMRQRSGAEIRSQRIGETELAAFEQAFFGTIHSFASHLLREYGFYIGVPAGFEVAFAVESLWKEFLQSASVATASEHMARVLRHVTFADLQAAANGCGFGRSTPWIPSARPSIDVATVLAHIPKSKASLPTVARGKRVMQSFAEAWASEADTFAELPSIEQGGEPFIELCDIALAPARKWLRSATAAVAVTLHNDFRAWRIANGLLTFDDQIAIASDLFSHPEAAKAIRERGYIVLLDEAQDTDPAQFSLLIESARPVDASGSWNSAGATPPEAGRFCMVGDFQQSIYSTRADLPTCLRAHELITAPGVGEALTFTTTFRCDTAVLDFANSIGPRILNGTGQQVSYVPLQTRAGAGPGLVAQLTLAAPTEYSNAEQLMWLEGCMIGAYLRGKGLAGLGVKKWSDVAVLAPRTAWLTPLASGMSHEGISSSILSIADRNCDRPTYLWTTAITTVLSEQRNTWEIAGVLRDIYGISDRDLALYTEGKGECLSLDRSHSASDPISCALKELSDVRHRTISLPLRDAIEIIDREILRPRVHALPVDVYGELDSNLDQMTALASKIEAGGGDMATFSKYLRDNLYFKPEAAGEDPSSVCLLTNHKSKGLEWSVVILPALFRDFSYKNKAYPRVIGEPGTPLDIAFNASDAEGFDCAAKKRIIGEIERLAYVSMTRAKTTLILVDDKALWAPEALGELTLARAFRLDEDPTTLTSLPVETFGQPAPESETLVKGCALAGIDLDRAREAAKNTPVKKTPHKLVRDSDREGKEAREDETLEPLPFSATQYGTWWHDTMRFMPWQNRSEWNPHFESALVSCPDEERARNEWDLFNKTDLAEKLSRAVIVRTECPFIVPADGNAVEGVIDLVFRSDEAWCVLDWKTTRSHTLDSALADYGPQLRPYRDVVRATMTANSKTGEGVAVETIIYLTSKGEYGRVA